MVNERVPMSAVTIDELTLADELAIAVFRTALTQPLQQLAVDLHGCGAWCGPGGRLGWARSFILGAQLVPRQNLRQR